MAVKENDVRTADEKAIDEWLPITSDRSAKWWFSAVHNVTAMVGAGCLSLPFALSEMGWGPGVAVLILSWAITFYTIWQMVVMHEIVPGKRFDRYHELGQHAFGPKLGLWIIVPQQLLVECSACIIYMVTGGKSLKKFTEVLRPQNKPIRLSYYILIFCSLQFVLSHLPNFNSISIISFGAAVMSVLYTTIAWAASLMRGIHEDVDYNSRHELQRDKTFGFLAALGEVAFAYAGHNVVLEIQATIPSTPECPSTKPMWRGVWVSYIVVAICYFPLAIIGFYVFGNTVEDNILLSLNKPAWLVAAGNMFVVMHVIGSYQVFSMPVFDMIETFMVKQMNFKPTTVLRVATRYSFVAITAFIGMTLPFFSGLLGFFGGFALAPTSYYIPCIIWLIICKPKRFSLSWFANWFCIVTGISLTILAPMGGLYKIIKSVKTYKMYS